MTHVHLEGAFLQFHSDLASSKQAVIMMTEFFNFVNYHIQKNMAFATHTNDFCAGANKSMCSDCSESLLGCDGNIYKLSHTLKHA